MNVKKMTDKKLDSLLKEVSAEVQRRKTENDINAKIEKELAALSRKYGSDTVKKLAATTKTKGRAAKKKVRAKVAPVYRNPDNHQQTWTGRGRTPLWVTEAEAKHNGRDALKIANQ
ncbi:MAG TPA: H-NS histone family protein [Gammaproteobacteria bacterium]|jgi:DNA-binding protein H-NS|nr:H-NS histone family protein [Gammaproteobacteria bacterium]HIJ21774.1 H-NS histone family protein [Gammaproteobacteria bacterium]HIJ27314.1 H-NS histone family protein [Gammaproteobacteria bacterium]HIJ32808.1 H-NS histone family protein [Gammaproteobacteria bacterium]